MKVNLTDEEILQIYRKHFEETGVQEWGQFETIFNPVTFTKEIILKNNQPRKNHEKLRNFIWKCI
jgi:hypothetical protein